MVQTFDSAIPSHRSVNPIQQKCPADPSAGHFCFSKTAFAGDLRGDSVC
jgi:hypothetical protein